MEEFERDEGERRWYVLPRSGGEETAGEEDNGGEEERVNVLGGGCWWCRGVA